MTSHLNAVVATAARTTLYGTLVAWGAVSAASQFTADGNIKIRKFDPYGLAIPNYHFFCPEPARHDMNLLYRDKFADGQIGPWQEVVLTQRRRLSHMVFYAMRRLDKGVMDLSNELVKYARITGELNRLSLTRPYMSFLNMVTYSVSHDPGATHTQFAFAHSAAYAPDVEPYVSFVSNFHGLPPSRATARAASTTAAP